MNLLLTIALLMLSPFIMKSCGGSSSGHVVSLHWTAAVDPKGAPPITGYNVYRSVHGQNVWTLLNPAGQLGLTFNDTSVAVNVTYDYQVTAQNSVGESPRSTTFTVLVP